MAALLDDFQINADDMKVNFHIANGDANFIADDNTINLPDPDWTEEVSGPDYNWTYYWQMVAHELAHKVIYEWFGGINHKDVFYAVLIALCAWWDLPARVMESESGYHPRGYQSGKQTMALLVMNGAHTISSKDSPYCDERPLFALEVSCDTGCTLHKSADEPHRPVSSRQQTKVLRAAE